MFLSAYKFECSNDLSSNVLRLLNRPGLELHHVFGFNHPMISPILPHFPMHPLILARSRFRLGRDGIGLSLL